MIRYAALSALGFAAGLALSAPGFAVPLNEDNRGTEPVPEVELQSGEVDGVFVVEKPVTSEPEVDTPVVGTFGAEPAPNARLEKLVRASARRLAVERGEIVEQQPEVVSKYAPLRNAPVEADAGSSDETSAMVTPAAPIDGARSMRRASRGYAYHVAKGATFGAELADGVSVIHVADLAEETAGAAGKIIIFPRPAKAPAPFQLIDALQTASDPSDPSPVERNAYELPVAVLDNVDIIPRVGRFREESPFPPCCGPTRLFLIQDPKLGFVITPNTRAFKPGQTFQFVPLTASVW